MSEPVITIRDRLIETLSCRGIGLHANVSISELADFGLMNGAMIVRAAGMYLELVESGAAGPREIDQGTQSELLHTSLAVTDQVASLSDNAGNTKMWHMFGKDFLDCFQLVKKIERAGSNPYEDPIYPRAITQNDEEVANLLDAQMADNGARYLASPSGRALVATAAKEVDGQGCPLRYRNDQNKTELEKVVASLVDEYLDSTSTFYGTGYYGLANFTLRAIKRHQPRDSDAAEQRFDWQLSMPK